MYQFLKLVTTYFLILLSSAAFAGGPEYIFEENSGHATYKTIIDNLGSTQINDGVQAAQGGAQIPFGVWIATSKSNFDTNFTSAVTRADVTGVAIGIEANITPNLLAGVAYSKINNEWSTSTGVDSSDEATIAPYLSIQSNIGFKITAMIAQSDYSSSLRSGTFDRNGYNIQLFAPSLDIGIGDLTAFLSHTKSDIRFSSGSWFEHSSRVVGFDFDKQIGDWGFNARLGIDTQETRGLGTGVLTFPGATEDRSPIIEIGVSKDIGTAIFQLKAGMEDLPGQFKERRIGFSILKPF